MKKIVLLLLLVCMAFASFEKQHLKKAIAHPAEALQKINFNKIINKWGEIFLHRQNEHSEEVVLEENPSIIPEPEQIMKAALDTVLNVTQV